MEVSDEDKKRWGPISAPTMAKAMTYAATGADWSGCNKSHMYEELAKGDIRPMSTALNTALVRQMLDYAAGKIRIWKARRRAVDVGELHSTFLAMARGTFNPADEGEVKAFHFDCGNSTTGPVGFCAVVRAESKEEAKATLRAALPGEARIHVDPVAFPEIEYVNVYFSPGNIPDSDLDVTETAV